MTAGGLVDEVLERLRATGLLPFVGDVTLQTWGGHPTAVVTVPLVAPHSTYASVDQALRGLSHACVLADCPARGTRTPTVEKDGRSWRVGAQDDVAWISAATTIGLSITAAVPPVFDGYATVVIPEAEPERRTADTALLEVLAGRTPDQPWWLGYLDTGAHDVVHDDAWKVIVYSGWSYVLVEAGPEQAGSWRKDDPWRGRLPELLFPADRSWLVSMLWDDDWRCLGGPTGLVDAVLADGRLDARQVTVDQDATPPGFVAH